MKKTSLLLLLSFLSFSISAEPISLAKNLAQDGKAAKENSKPIVFFVTASDCPFCELLREAYFQFSPSDERIILREIERDQAHSIIDFDGSQSDHENLASDYDTFLTPTVLFAGPDGELIADPIVGVLTLDFYHYYFEKELSKAQAELNTKLGMKTSSNQSPSQIPSQIKLGRDAQDEQS